VTLAVPLPLAGLLALAPEQFVVKALVVSGSLVYTTLYCPSHFSQPQSPGIRTAWQLGSDPRCGLLGMRLPPCVLIELMLLEESGMFSISPDFLEKR